MKSGKICVQISVGGEQKGSCLGGSHTLNEYISVFLLDYVTNQHAEMYS